MPLLRPERPFRVLARYMRHVDRHHDIGLGFHKPHEDEEDPNKVWRVGPSDLPWWRWSSDGECVGWCVGAVVGLLAFCHGEYDTGKDEEEENLRHPARVRLSATQHLFPSRRVMARLSLPKYVVEMVVKGLGIRLVDPVAEVYNDAAEAVRVQP